ncbi:SGNH/GDSL hydrolase family protein [Pseudomonas cerasi]|uniref:SGNH hydrolase-type esterase domain-containing protein n=1 Tax=Pseudomonas cerasi TaxID=1583341 RepID=A0A193SSH8_9PSED|nr:SGNH/GDSL hydrolase family protein [Pseudomonas cerasi]CZT30146.1 hypothetical protein PCPL58_3690 [Pseudomonas cerasi]SOS21867.1 hypothetical protein PL963_03780 [Pseudomonas cerasi]
MNRILAIAAIFTAGVATAQPGFHGPARYVSMGSSYAAGPGVGTPDPAGASCGRSSSNFADIFARRRHLLLVDVSCSGATTDNLLYRGQHGLRAQIEMLTPDTRLVTVLIGGNDVDYVRNMLGLSCRATGGTNCHVVDDAEVKRHFQMLPDALDRVVVEIRHRAPDARIVLVDYLPAVPTDASSECPSLPLSPRDAARMRAVATRLARVIGSAAQRNGVGIVRSSTIGAGHALCSAQPFIAGYHLPGGLHPSPIIPIRSAWTRLPPPLTRPLDPRQISFVLRRRTVRTPTAKAASPVCGAGGCD